MTKVMTAIKQNAFTSKWRWLILGLIIGSVGLSWSGAIDRYTTAYIDEALVQASSAFVIARAMNALISFLQSVTFEFSVGIGGSVGAGQVLDPLNDLVEQYSSAMKLAIGSLVIQKVLLEIVSDNIFKILLTISGVAVLISAVINRAFAAGYLGLFLLRLFLALLFLRFALVLVVAANGIVDQAFLHQRTENQLHILESIEGVNEQENKFTNPELHTELTANITELQQQAATLRQRLNTIPPQQRAQLQRQLADINNQIQLAELAREGKTPGFFAAISDSFSSLGDGIAAIKDAVNPRQVYQIKERLDNAVTNILNLMALFFLKTLLLPLLFLYVLNKGFTLIWRSNPGVVLQPVSK
ncbi:hypothetical protein [Arsukibacterium indicum]|uniref:Uncharacterized protein n=1 Tax=Arsukibacterium indicum TaxID=2848612 RepID=A0ABS6MM27_9GAMM|nr:hypothetical protein [Arsukibacterium indicum]MBV2129856.1 hypothetical protein [Arsukibacterium indicum]